MKEPGEVRATAAAAIEVSGDELRGGIARVTFAAGDRDAVGADKEPRAIRNVGEPSDNARCSVSDTHARMLDALNRD